MIGMPLFQWPRRFDTEVRDMSMVHYLTIGHLDPDAIRGGVAVAMRPLEESAVRTARAQFPTVAVEARDGYLILPWHGLGPTGSSEALARRLHELTGCLIADRRNGRLIDPTTLASAAPRIAV